MNPATADYMGMLATVLNAVALQDALERLEIETRCLTAIHVGELAEPYIRRRALRHLERKRVVILAAGTGNPTFTTDTAAAVRAAELQADVILKGTKVDGVYDRDPKAGPGAIRYERLTYQHVIEKHLRVMDATAITLCRERNIPVIVFNLWEDGAMLAALRGDPVGTTISADG
jgi:uridylate kinase